MTRWGCLILGLLLSPGCVVVDLGVTNPVAGLSKVAIVPFFNLSAEPPTTLSRLPQTSLIDLIARSVRSAEAPDGSPAG